MDRAFSSGASGTPPAAPVSPSSGYPTAGNPGTATPATTPGAWWYYMITEELRKLIVDAGLTPDFSNTSQISQAVQAMIANGAANDYKASVRFTTTGNITLSGLGTQAGGDWTAPLTAGDRILPKDQTVGSQNGIYIAAAGAWTRATDADGAGELTSGAIVAVEEGSTNADSQWMLITDGPITLGTTALVFSQKNASVQGGAVQGLSKNLQASATGSSASISISADEIVVESAGNASQTLRNVSLTASLASSGANGLDDSSPQTVSVTIAPPGVFTLNNHGFPGGAWGAAVVLATTGALPTGLSQGTTYYVVNPTTNTFQLSSSRGGSAINTSGTQSGSHTIKSVLAVNSWYSKWIISNGITTAALLSSSATNPVLPSGYTHKARTGWVPTDGTANKFPLRFKQDGNMVWNSVGGNVTNSPLMASGSAGNPATASFVAVAISAFVPSTASEICVSLMCSNANTYASCAQNGNYGVPGSANTPPLVAGSTSGGNIMNTCNGFLPIESSNIYWNSLGTTASLLWCLGWRDSL